MLRLTTFLIFCLVFIGFEANAQLRLQYGNPSGKTATLGAKINFFIVADRSGSMSGEKMDKLNAALQDTWQKIAADPVLKQTAQVALIAFDDYATMERSPSTLTGNPQQPFLVATGGTNLTDALALVESAVTGNSQENVVIILSDGLPNDPSTALQAAQRLQSRAIVQAVAIGDAQGGGVDFSYMQNLVGQNNAAVLSGTKFKPLFSDIVDALRLHVNVLGGKILVPNYSFYIPNNNHWKK
ncbi:vWA domain-containing protein [Hugenholtzia roseola]|uniref:vWA domain-containing protein n=1 Tax=Hugenholtzia roseola TaxID=1002 RepID=UPI0003F7EADF|nr:VWA domain-containing protein [Hugenholtzia roseola]